MRAQERELVAAVERRDVGGIEPVLSHMIGEGAPEGARGELRQRGQIDPEARFVAQRLGADGIFHERVAHPLEDVDPLVHERLRDLEDAIEVLWVLDQIDEAPQALRHHQSVRYRVHRAVGSFRVRRSPNLEGARRSLLEINMRAIAHIDNSHSPRGS